MEKKKTSIFWLFKIIKKDFILMFILSLSSMLVSASYVIPALLSKGIVNVAVNANSLDDAKPKIILYAIYFLIFVVLLIAFLILNSHLKVVISGRLEMRMRHNFFESITKKQFPYIKNLHSGEILNRFTSDIDVVVSGITTFIPDALSIITKVIAGFFVIFAYSKGYSAFILGVGIVIIIGALCIKPIFKRVHKQMQEASGVMRSFTQECTENMIVIKSFANRIPLLKKLDSYMQRIYKLKIFRNTITNIAGGGATFVYQTVYYATMVWGAFMIAGKQLDYGTLMAFMQIISQVSSPFFNASSLISQFYSVLASAERLRELEDYPDEITRSDFAPDLVYDELDSICAENLNFKYEKDSVIEHTTFEIKKGACVAITGPSGAGKSTLFKLILGLHNVSSGRLYAKTKDGSIDLSSITRPLFAYVPQGNMLVSGTISENIKFGNLDVSDEKMIEAAKTACIYDFIMTLDDGFDTKIGEKGSGLSEGQIQRIAVARALCCDAPILLLDECTSALDSVTEENMLSNIEALKTKTVFFISHKNAALSMCDTRLHMENKVFSII